MLDVFVMFAIAFASLKVGQHIGMREANFDRERMNLKLQECITVVTNNER